MNIMKMQDVCYVRNERPILNKINWTINKGEHWSVLGANGSGKTTLLKLLTAYEWVTTGTIQVLGKTYGNCHVGIHRKQLGWVSASLQRQIPNTDTVKHVVASGVEASFGWYGRWDDEIENAIQRALSRLNINHLIDQSYATLSQGEQKRVQIARAIVHQPKLLILDEPCEGLDPVNRVRLLDELTQFIEHPDSPSIIYVTHHIDEIRPWMEYTHLLKEGKTLTQGKTVDLITADNLKDTFGQPCTIEKRDQRYSLTIDH